MKTINKNELEYIDKNHIFPGFKSVNVNVYDRIINDNGDILEVYSVWSSGSLTCINISKDELIQINPKG